MLARLLLVFSIFLCLANSAIQADEDFAPVSDPTALGPGREFLPAALTDVGIDEKLGDQLPIDLVFKNDRGQAVRLKEIFNGEVPVVLSLNYSNCPLLCLRQLNGLVRSLSEIDLVAGKDYRIVSVSLDPAETIEQAAATKEKYLSLFGDGAYADGWNFLVGSKSSIDRLAQAIGIRYVYIAEKKEYSHPAVFSIVMPDGRISRYHYGIEFVPQTIRLSLVEASEGKIGTTLDRFLLLCFHYDANAGSYSLTAKNIMKWGAALFLVVLMGLFWACHRVYHARQLLIQTIVTDMNMAHNQAKSE